MKHSNKYDPFEQKIKKALDQFEMPYNPADWAAMDAMLNKKRKKRAILFFPNRIAFTAGTGLAAILVGLLMGWNLYVNNFLPADKQLQNQVSTQQNDQNLAQTNQTAAINTPINSNQPITRTTENAIMAAQTANVPTPKRTMANASAQNKTNTPQIAQASSTTPIWHNTTSSSKIVVAAADDIPTLYNTTETSPTPENILADAVTTKTIKQPTEQPQNLSEKQATPVLLPTLMAQNITNPLPQTKLKTASTPNIKAPKAHKKRFLVGLQTAFTQTFTNKSQQQNYVPAIGISAEYKLTPHWAIETGTLASKNKVNFASPTPIVLSDFYSPKITGVQSNQIEIPLLIKHYFTPEARTQAYLSAGTAFVHQTNIAYNIYIPSQTMLDIAICDCANTPPITNAMPNEDTNYNVAEKVVQPKLATNNRFDWVQIHGGLQYQINKNLVLQADATIKTNLKANNIYDANAQNSPITNAESQTPLLLSNKYHTTTTGVQLGLLYRF
jgi:hypothetical protein